MTSSGAHFLVLADLKKGGFMDSSQKVAFEAYKSQCGSLRVPGEGDGRCDRCVHYEGDPEVDECNLHQLYHDWDQEESRNFTSFVCDDFRPQKSE